MCLHYTVQKIPKDYSVYHYYHPKILNLLKEKGIKKCYYGHLHGMAAKYAFDDNFEGIDFKLISADRLKFVPLLIKKF